MARNTGPKTVQCYHCRHRFEVGGRAQSTSCPGCNKELRLEDFVFDKKKSGIGRIKVQTCGSVTVKKSGRVTAELLEAHGGIVCEGTIQAKQIISGKPVVIGKAATFRGDLQAPSLDMKLGAKVGPSMIEVPSDPLGLADL